jgi:3'-phosphoadenosine 5'-phosphosulfate sulfotransferase (PAPS reductase)/FAD synthetase
MLQLSVLRETQHFVPISGKDSLATALAVLEFYPDINFRYIFNDVGSEFPEVYQWLAAIEEKTGWKIERTSVTIEEKIQSWNGFLPSHQNRWCTRDCKIKPMDKAFSEFPAFVYYGLRADEPDRKGFIPTRKLNIYPVFPLRENGITLRHVWSIVESRGLLPPAFHWARLEEAVQAELPESKWIALEPWQRRMLFAGRTRSNCYHCFYQRLYEWVWLYETHPTLFAKAKAFEKPGYSWNQDHPLDDFESPEFREKQFQKRVRALVAILSGKAKEGDSEISGTSCGLICGK